MTALILNSSNYNILFTDIESKMKNNAYPDWKIFFIEHLIRAIVNRLILKYYGTEQYKKCNSSEKENGFIYMDYFLRFMENFETLKNINFIKYFEDNLTNFLNHLSSIKG